MTRTVYLAASSLDEFFDTVGAIAMGSSTFEWAVRSLDLLASGRWREEWCARPAWVFSSRPLVTPDDPDIRPVSGAPLFPRRMTDRLSLANVASDGHFAFLDYTVGAATSRP